MLTSVRFVDANAIENVQEDDEVFQARGEFLQSHLKLGPVAGARK
jgi:hypothetical protein